MRGKIVIMLPLSILGGTKFCGLTWKNPTYPYFPSSQFSFVPKG